MRVDTCNEIKKALRLDEEINGDNWVENVHFKQLNACDKPKEAYLGHNRNHASHIYAYNLI